LLIILLGRGGQAMLPHAKAIPNLGSTSRYSCSRMQDCFQPVHRSQFRKESGHGHVELLLVIGAKDQPVPKPGNGGGKPDALTKDAGDPADVLFRLINSQGNRVSEVDAAKEEISAGGMGVIPLLLPEDCLDGADYFTYLAA
jgi:hypothetical protein